MTEDLAELLASVCGNDLEPILSLTRDPTINEYVRSAALRALIVLVSEGEMPREDLVAYLREQFINHPREPIYYWTNLVSAALAIYPEELLHEIESAFDDGLVDTFMVRPDDVQRQLARCKEATLQMTKERYRFISDTIRHMERWACFHPDKNDRIKASTVESQRGNIPEPHTAKVGRNDPCPCGSGKKYKKCCLN